MSHYTLHIKDKVIFKRSGRPKDNFTLLKNASWVKMVWSLPHSIFHLHQPPSETSWDLNPTIGVNFISLKAIVQNIPTSSISRLNASSKEVTLKNMFKAAPYNHQAARDLKGEMPLEALVPRKTKNQLWIYMLIGMKLMSLLRNFLQFWWRQHQWLMKLVVMTFQLLYDGDQPWKHLRPHLLWHSRFHWSACMIYLSSKGSWKPRSYERKEVWKLAWSCLFEWLEFYESSGVTPKILRKLFIYLYLPLPHIHTLKTSFLTIKVL